MWNGTPVASTAATGNNGPPPPPAPQQQRQREPEGSRKGNVTSSSNSAAAGVAAEKQEPPPTVLGCPDCDFLCTSNNQMCRHMFLTCHGVENCSQCSARLVCWAFAPGVQKLFVRAKKDGVLVEVSLFETAEKHQERTGHVNMHVAGKEKYVKPGLPEDYGLVVTRPTQAETPSSKYCCPECQRTINTWTQMTKHLDSTKHATCRCAECDVVLKCYGMSQPLRHEKLTGHNGLVGLFRTKMDYLSTARGSPAIAQYGCKDCGIGYLHPLHLLAHLGERHQLPLGRVKCEECDESGTVAEMCRHRLSTGHEQFDYNCDPTVHPIPFKDYMLSLPEPAPNIESITSGSCRILYQCPQCFFIATSWAVFERHLYATKHDLAYCVQCSAFLPPLLETGEVSHKYNLGHKIVFGEQKARSDYEVLVDLTNRDVASLIHPASPGGVLPSLHQQMVEGRVVYQCPHEDCAFISLESAALDRHFQATKHGIVKCKCCELEFSVAQEQWRTHEFDPQEMPMAILEMQRTDEDCRVWTEDETLTTYFGDVFRTCPLCHMVVEKSKLPSHQSSLQCLVRKAKKSIVDAAGGHEAGLLAGVLPVAATPAPVGSPLAGAQAHHVVSSPASAPASLQYAQPPGATIISAPPGTAMAPQPQSFTLVNSAHAPAFFVPAAAPNSSGGLGIPAPPPPVAGQPQMPSGVVTYISH